MLKAIEAALILRTKIAARIGKKLAGGEAVCHFLYGIAIFTETHGELTFYSISAVMVGTVSLVMFLLGGNEEA